MQQAVNPAQVNKRAVVGQVLDLPFDDDALFEVVERVALLRLVLFIKDGLARQDDVRALAIELDDLGFDLLILERVEVAERARINLRAGQERRDAVHINAQAALDALDDAPFDRRAFAVSLLQIVPRAHAHGVGARQDGLPFLRLHALDEHFDFVAALDHDLAVLHELFERHETFGLEAEVYDDATVVDADDLAGHDRAFLEVGLFGLLLLVLFEDRAEVGIARAARLFLFVGVSGFGGGCARRRSGRGCGG